MTTFLNKNPLIIFPLLIALCLSGIRAADAPAPGKTALDLYKKHTAPGITITYPGDEQDFVDEIIGGYRFPIRLIEEPAFEAQFARWKKHDLAFIAKKLAIENPTAAMLATFEQFRDLCLPIVSQEIQEIRIYHFTDIKAAHARGISVEGISYIPQTDSISIANHIAADAPDGRKIRVMPIVLMQKVPGMVMEKMRLFNGTLRDMRWRLDEAVYNAYFGKLSEIVKPEIIATVSQGRSPLWFIEGMTYALPLAVMQSHNPNLSFDQLLQAHVPPPPDFARHAATINLETWLLGRTASTTKSESDSYLYLSLLAALDAIQENGDDWLPEFFTRLRGENSSSLNMGVIQALFTELTKADLRETVTRVKARITIQAASKS